MVSFPGIIQMWRNGCIIQYVAGMLENISAHQGDVDRDLLHHHGITEEITKNFEKIVAKGVDTNSTMSSISVSLELLKFSAHTIIPTQFYEARLYHLGKHKSDLKSEPAGEPVTEKNHFERKAAQI